MGLFDPPDPNDPMAAFQQAPPGLAEIIFKLAGSMAPLAPFIGGTRTPMGRMLGAGAVLGGGASNAMADMIEKQRLDPQAQLARMAQSILAQGTKPTPGTPAQQIPTQGPLLESGAFDSSGGARPVETIPAGPPGPPTFDPNNLPLPTQALVEKYLPALGPKYQSELAKNKAEIEQAATRNRLIEKQINAPLAVHADTTLVDPNNPSIVLRAAVPSEAVRERQAREARSLEFAQAVEAEMKSSPQLTIGDAANKVQQRSPSKWYDVPADNPMMVQGREKRAEDTRILQENRSEDKRIAANERIAERQLRVQREELDFRTMPGIFADRKTGEITPITVGEWLKHKDEFKKLGQGEADTASLLKTATPMIDRLEVLIPKVLALSPKDHLATVMSNYLHGKYGDNADLQELKMLGIAMASEQGRALGGSSRVLGSIFTALRGEATPSMAVTAPVASRMTQTVRREIDNRIRSITGQPLQEYKPTEVTVGKPAPGFGVRLPNAPVVAPNSEKLDPAVQKYLDSVK